MSDTERRYETKTATAVRGTEGRAITKWENDGWELVGQKSGKLKSELTFRRPKPPLKKLPLALAAGGLVLVVAAVSVGVIKERGTSTHQPSPTSSAAGTSTASTSPNSASSGAAVSTAPTTRSTILTVANSPELTEFLSIEDYCDDRVGQLTQRLAEDTIQFDASVANVAPHGNYKTRFDVLLAPGDKGPLSTKGPALQLRDVNLYDLHFTGEEPAYLEDGTKIRLTATVVGFNEKGCLVYLDPVESKLLP